MTRELGHEPPREGHGAFSRADDGDDGCAPQVRDGGHARDLAVGLREQLRLPQENGVGRFGGRVLGCDAELEPRHRGRADTGLQVVGVASPPVPEAGRVVHQRREPGAVGMHEPGRVRGRRRLLAELGALAFEVVEVSLAADAQRSPCPAARRDGETDARDDRDDEHDAGDEEEQRLAVAHDDHHRDGRQRADDRQQELERRCGRLVAQGRWRGELPRLWRRGREDGAGGPVGVADAHGRLPGRLESGAVGLAAGRLGAGGNTGA